MDVEEQREQIRTILGKIAELSQLVDEAILDGPHSKNITHRSLKPKSSVGEHIVYFPEGFNALYKHTDGLVYEIRVHRFRKL